MNFASLFKKKGIEKPHLVEACFIGDSECSFSQHIKSLGTETARLCGESSHRMPVLSNVTHVRIETMS